MRNEVNDRTSSKIPAPIVYLLYHKHKSGEEEAGGGGKEKRDFIGPFTLLLGINCQRVSWARKCKAGDFHWSLWGGETCRKRSNLVFGWSLYLTFVKKSFVSSGIS